MIMVEFGRGFGTRIGRIGNGTRIERIYTDHSHAAELHRSLRDADRRHVRR
jgi:hypothetical protein